MNGRQVILGEIKGRRVAALMVDGVLDDLMIDAPEGTGFAPETLCRATVDRPLKGQGGVMVRLPEGNGFFRGAKGLSQGQEILVQVVAHAEEGKAQPVTDKVIFKGRSVIVTPGASGVNISRRIRDEEVRLRLRAAIATEAVEGTSHGIIIRSEAPMADDDEIAEEAEALIASADRVLADGGSGPEVLLDAPDAWELAWREWSLLAEGAPDESDGALEHSGAMEGIEALLTPHVPLAGGASMFIEPTRALIAVDVNTGADTSAAAGLKANIAAARALPRQMRLRGFGGQITIDFAPCPKRDRKTIEQALGAAFRADRVETTLVGWTPLGHFELTRKRERLPLAQVLGGAV
ncbi:ribonuclease E/G [Alphaproteobacteria bacterium KMM 3653]|uniref:Ribonuclease E/G n=1 Tax=Harenicola maris TaxID=2841044 RepID=A0AAP2G9C7_9RHOB|nr:ribonuclease E/G [Harenicola maris]